MRFEECCARCKRKVYPSDRKEALCKVWHAFCFSCVKCRKPLDLCSYRCCNDEIYCEACFRSALCCAPCAPCITPQMPCCCDPCSPGCGGPLCTNLRTGCPCGGQSTPSRKCPRKKTTECTESYCLSENGCKVPCCTSLNDQECCSCNNKCGDTRGVICCYCPTRGPRRGKGTRCDPCCEEVICKPCRDPCCSCCGSSIVRR